MGISKSTCITVLWLPVWFKIHFPSWVSWAFLCFLRGWSLSCHVLIVSTWSPLPVCVNSVALYRASLSLLLWQRSNELTCQVCLSNQVLHLLFSQFFARPDTFLFPAFLFSWKSFGFFVIISVGNVCKNDFWNFAIQELCWVYLCVSEVPKRSWDTANDAWKDIHSKWSSGFGEHSRDFEFWESLKLWRNLVLIVTPHNMHVSWFAPFTAWSQ